MITGFALQQYVDWARNAISNRVNDVTGNIQEAYQAIIDLWEIDCAGNWVIYVRLAFPSALAALWLLLTPSPQEILESYLEPKGGRKGKRRGIPGDRHHRNNRAGQRRLFFGGGIPDLDNLIADNLAARHVFAGRKVGPTEWLFWTGIRVSDAIAWNFLLIEAAYTFVTKWQSALIASGQCKNVGYATASLQTVQFTGNMGQTCWGGVVDLFSHETVNATIGANGYLVIDGGNVEAHGILTIESTHVLSKDQSPGTAVVQCGWLLQVFDYASNLLDAVNKVEEVWVGPNEIQEVPVSDKYFFEGAKTFNLSYWYTTLTPWGVTTRKADLKLAMNATGVRFV